MTPSTQDGPAGGGSTYSLEILAKMSGVSSQTILLYQEHGLVQEENSFDDETVRIVRRIDHLRTACETNMTGLKMMMQLLNEVEELRERLRLSR